MCVYTCAYMCACVCLCVLHIYAYMFLFYYARICEYACVIREYESICVLDTSFSKAWNTRLDLLIFFKQK